MENEPDQPVELEDDIRSLAMSSLESKSEDKSDDCDFFYILEILRASIYLPEDSDTFLLLEKQQYLKGKDTSEVSRLQRRLIFDTINEILDRNRQLPPWKPDSWTSSALLQPIWSEFQRIQERDAPEDLFEEICAILRKDFVMGDAITGWVDCSIVMFEAVLEIERLIFKDLIGETIGDLAVLCTCLIFKDLIVETIGDLAVLCTYLYNKVMAMMADGYSEDMLATVFDHLCENKKAAREFLTKNAMLRKLWVDAFLFNQLRLVFHVDCDVSFRN